MNILCCNRQVNFIMMVGVSGSGKSTVTDEWKDQLTTAYSKEVADKYFTVISSDALREELYGDATTQEHNEEVFKELNRRVIDAFQKGYNIVVADATYLNYKSRKELLLKVSQVVVKGSYRVNKIAYVVNTNIDTCYYQNKNRDRVVPINVIDRQIKTFECPQYFEGFDQIEFHNELCMDIFDRKADYALQNTLLNYNQHNPHHRYTLNKHISKVADYVKDNFDNQGLNKNLKFSLYEAARIHDIGKVGCPSTDDKDITHYYNHENYGTYLLITNPNLCFYRNKDEFLQIAFFVNNHMKPFNFTNEKTENKYRQLWGKDLYNCIMFLHIADVQSSGTEKIHDQIKALIDNTEITNEQRWEQVKKLFEETEDA